MKLIAHGADSKRALFEALIRLPADARAFALTKVGFLLLDPREVHGYAIDASAFAGAEWFVVVGARAGMLDTLGHEIAHCALGHLEASADAEREAVKLTREWGFASADPEAHAAAFEPWDHKLRAVVTWAAPTGAAQATADAVAFECATCDGLCRVLCPTVAGLPANIGAECRRCGRLDIVSLAGLVPCQCGERPSVTWAAEATPQQPMATWVCGSCNATATRTIQSAPAPPAPAFDLIVPIPDEAPWCYFARAAARVLALDGDVAWARRQLRRALDEMDGDPRREHVQAALDALVRGDAGGGAAALALALDEGSHG